MNNYIRIKYPAGAIQLQQRGLVKTATQSAFLYLFKKWTSVLLLFAALLQCVFFFSMENLFAVGCILVAWGLTSTFVFRQRMLSQFTLSSLIIIGFSLTQYCLPLIFTLVEGKPVVFNLQLPYEVFVHSILSFFILLVTHAIYRSLRKGNSRFRPAIKKVMSKGGMFSPPADMQIWIMGLIGLAGMMATYLTGNRYGIADEDRGMAAKILQGLIPFTYAPLFIPLRRMFDHRQQTKKTSIIKIALYTLLILVVGIGGNSRGLFMTGITSFFIAYFIGLLLGKFNYRIINIKNASFVLIGFWILTGPLADVGTAMLVVRDQRTDLTSQELISRTINAYQNKSALEAYRLTAKEDVVVQDWDEHYFNNIFLARFCNLKFNDEGLKQSKKIGGIDKEMQEYSVNRFLAIMPRPLLSLFKVDLDKETVISASFGDFLFSRAGGENALGGFRTGQFASTGMTAFGWWYLLLLGVGMIPVFFLVDLFVIHKQVSKQNRYRTYLSLGGLIPITHFFMFLSLSSTSESVVNIYAYLFRGWIELVILYGVVLFISRKLSSLLKQLNFA